MDLNIITRCTRMHNLLTIRDSIFTTNKFKVIWHISFDTSIIKNIDGDVISSLNSNDIRIKFVNGVDGDFGHQLINGVIDKIESGLIYVLDDDNIIHEDFYTEIYDSIVKNPDKSGFIFHQKVGKKDFTGLDIRIASPENTKVHGIDMAQFLVKKELIGGKRLPLMDYKADGIFIEDLFKSKPDEFLFIDKELCYYNFLGPKKKSHFLPKILVLGTEENINLESKFIAGYESTKLEVLSKMDDSNLHSIIKNFNPDSIATIGENYNKFSNLNYMPLDIRRRWLHFNDISDIGEASYQSAMNYILSQDNSETPLISFFTPIYNTGEKLLRTYESVKNQTYTNWEWVLVNDSTDSGKTLKVAESISEKDCRVKVYDFKEKSGGVIGESKYRAASLCKGKYLMELDHDDDLLPEAAYWMVQAFKKYPDCKFCYSDCAEIDESHNSLTYGDGFSFGYGSYRDEVYNGKIYKAVNTQNINPITIRHIVGVPNHFRAWDRIFYHSIGGHNRRLTITDDYELVVRTFLNTKIVRIPKMLYLQYFHNSNTQDASRSDIQRRVRTIRNFYNKAINDRFIQLGIEDWAYNENPGDPTRSASRFGDREGAANYIFKEEIDKIQMDIPINDMLVL